VASAVGSAVLVGLSALLLIVRYKWRGKSGMPASGPDTTLVVTDIQVASWRLALFAGLPAAS
jgi:hypothetical protein